MSDSRSLLQVSPSQQLHPSLPPLPLYDQPPCSPYTSPESSTAPPFPRSPSVNGEHKLTPTSHKAPALSKTPNTITCGVKRCSNGVRHRW